MKIPEDWTDSLQNARFVAECALLEDRASEDSATWARRERVINALVFWERDHCARAWAAEVARANRTLEMNRANPVE